MSLEDFASTCGDRSAADGAQRPQPAATLMAEAETRKQGRRTNAERMRIGKQTRTGLARGAHANSLVFGIHCRELLETLQVHALRHTGWRWTLTLAYSSRFKAGHLRCRARGVTTATEVALVFSQVTHARALELCAFAEGKIQTCKYKVRAKAHS
jgi:hypothetical protein